MLIKRAFFLFLLFLPLSAIAYLGWRFGIENNKSATDGRIFLAYLAVLVPLIIQIFTLVFNMVEKSMKNRKENDI